VTDVHDSEAEVQEYRGNWLVRTIYIGLIAANLYLVFDWWRDTPQGAAAVERWRARIEAAKAKAENCEGCAKRKKWLQGQINRVHYQAEEIVTEAAETAEPEQP
jgi:hypothetical protein